MPYNFPKPPPYDHDHENEVTLFAKTNYRSQMRTFGIKTDDRRRHTYVIGKTGMGKSVLLENFALADIYAGHGLAFIDPHGDTAQRLLDFIPEHRIKDVVYFNPADTAYPVGFNIFETVGPDQKHLVANGLMGVFKKIWPDVWSARMEYILQNSILVLLDAPGSTFLGINRLFVDEEFRARTVGVCQDPLVKTFWLKEFAAFTEKYRTEAVAPVQNKVGQFLSASIIRNIVAQQKSTINIREIMDTRKIFIVNLSKGLVGEENSRLLGAMIITRLQLAAMERVDIPVEDDRQDFYLYVDEFQNFATESFASILSEARKYRLNLIVAHQYIEQLDETVRAAIFGNVGTIISFRVGAADAMFMENEFAPTFLPEDLVNLTKYTIYLKLMINGAASEPFSASTLPPIAKVTGSRDAVIQSSRIQYAMERSLIEKMVIRWSGYGTADAGAKIESEEEIEEKSEQDRMLDEIEERNRKEMEALARTSPDVGEAVEPQPAFGQKKKKEAKYEIPCTVCGEPQKLTFEPDYSKPWYCKNHLEQKEKDAAAGKFSRRPDRPPFRDDRPPRSDDRPPRRDDRPVRNDRPSLRDDRPPRDSRPPRRDDRPPRPAPPPLGSGSVRILTGDQGSEDEVPLSELLSGGKKKDDASDDRPPRRDDRPPREERPASRTEPSSRDERPAPKPVDDDDDIFPKSDDAPSSAPKVVFKSPSPAPAPKPAPRPEHRPEPRPEPRKESAPPVAPSAVKPREEARDSASLPDIGSGKTIRITGGGASAAPVRDDRGDDPQKKKRKRNRKKKDRTDAEGSAPRAESQPSPRPQQQDAAPSSTPSNAQERPVAASPVPAPQREERAPTPPSPVREERPAPSPAPKQAETSAPQQRAAAPEPQPKPQERPVPPVTPPPQERPAAPPSSAPKPAEPPQSPRPPQQGGSADSGPSDAGSAPLKPGQVIRF